MSYFIYELKLSLKSKLFIFAMILSFLSIVFGILGNRLLIEMEEGLTLFFSGFSFSTSSLLPLLAPLIAALPMGNTYLNDQQNNMITAIFVRMTKKKYFFIKFFSVGVMGSLVIVLPLICLFLLNLLIYPSSAPAYMGEIGGPFSTIFKENQRLYAGLLILNSGLFGFIYANIGFVSSIFIKNKYITAFFPLIIYFFPSFIFPLLHLDRYEPVTTFDLSANTTTTFQNIYIQFAFLLVVLFSIGTTYFSKENKNDQ